MPNDKYTSDAAETDPPPELPIAVTTTADVIDNRTAVLNGEINPKGLLVRYYFRYDFQPNVNDSSDQTMMQHIDPGGGETLIPVNSTARFLQPNKKYYFRIVATTPAGGGYIMGDIKSFQTPE